MTELTSIDRFSPRTYRRASNASYVVGIVAFVAGLLVGRPLLGVVGYVAGFALGVAIPNAASRPVYDERDEELAARASELVLTGLSFGGFVVFVSLYVLSILGQFTWSSELLAVFWAWSAFWLLWGGTYTYVRLRA